MNGHSAVVEPTPAERSAMPFRLTPRDDRFYSMFTAAAANLVTGATLLGDQLAAGLEARRRDRRPHARRRARRRRDHTRDHPHGELHVRHPVRPRGHLRARLAPRRRAWTTWTPPPTSSSCTARRAAAGARRPGRRARSAAPSSRRGHAAAAHPCRTCRVLDRDQPPRERGATGSTAGCSPTLFSGEYEPIEVLKLKDVVEELEAAADAFEQVAHTVETIAVKES